MRKFKVGKCYYGLTIFDSNVLKNIKIDIKTHKCIDRISENNKNVLFQICLVNSNTNSIAYEQKRKIQYKN